MSVIRPRVSGCIWTEKRKRNEKKLIKAAWIKLWSILAMLDKSNSSLDYISNILGLLEFDLFPVPSCPYELAPHAYKCPSSVRANVWA